MFNFRNLSPCADAFFDEFDAQLVGIDTANVGNVLAGAFRKRARE